MLAFSLTSSPHYFSHKQTEEYLRIRGNVWPHEIASSVLFVFIISSLISACTSAVTTLTMYCHCGFRVNLTVSHELVLSPPDVAEKDPPDLLNKRKCLEYLASLRHAKWFQVSAPQLCLPRLCVTPPTQIGRNENHSSETKLPPSENIYLHKMLTGMKLEELFHSGYFVFLIDFDFWLTARKAEVLHSMSCHVQCHVWWCY